MKLKQNAIFFTILLLIFLVFAALWLWAGYPVALAPSVGGTRDLRAADFESGSIDLHGPVEYIPNALLTPEEFEARQSDIQTGLPEDAVSYSTSRLRVYVPAGTYGLMMWNAEFATSIYINGLFVENVGLPASTAEGMVAGARILYYTVEAPDGVIEIMQQSSDFMFPGDDTYADVIIGKPEPVRENYDKLKTLPLIMMACFLALALSHLVLYSTARAYKANLWFALFCLVFLIRTGCIANILPSFMPVSPYTLIRLVSLSEATGALLLCLTLHALFPGILQKWFRVALAAVCGVYACVSMFAGVAFASGMGVYFSIIIILAAVYIFIRICVKTRKPSVEQIAILAGMGIFVLSSLRDIVIYALISMFGSAGPAPDTSNLSYVLTAEVGLIIFVFFQMAAMFRGTMREIAAAREAEQNMAMENALLAHEAKVREDMVRNLSHEVRTPLTVISTYAQLAVRQFREGKIDEQTVDGLDAVYEEANRIAELATNTLSPKEQGDSIVDLAEVARQLVRLYMPMAAAAGRTLHANLSKRLPTSCNAGEITQVIWNLLDNAMKHGERGNIDVDGNLNDEYVYIVVTDYGVGIPPDMLPNVLKRGVSSGGSGLGLAIANEIAVKHGGKLIIESEYGLGTAATLLLPVYRGKEAKPHGE